MTKTIEKLLEDIGNMNSGKNNNQDNNDSGPGDVSTLARLDQIAQSNYIQYSKIPAAVKENMLDLGKMLYQADKDKLIVTGDSLTGKTFSTEQFSYHADKILHNAKMVPDDMPVAVFYADARSFHGGKEDKFVEYAKNTILDFRGEVIFYTNNFYTLQILEYHLPSVHMIAELTPETLNEIMQSGIKLSNYSIASEFSINFGKSDTVSALRAYHKQQIEDHYGVELPKNFINYFVSHIYKNAEITKDPEGNEVSGAIPMGYWVRMLNESIGEAVFKSDKYRNDDGSFDQKAIVNHALLENSEIFNPGTAYKDIMEAMNEMFGDALDGEDGKSSNDKPRRTIIMAGPPAGFGAPGTQTQTQSENSRGNVDINYSDMMTLSDRIKEKVVGQDKVVEEVSNGFKVAAIGLNDDDKPIRSMLFLGPTGVGKTKLAQTLAEELTVEPMNMIRLDMSEYSKEHDSHKLFGAPAGYVGHERGGVLTSQVMENPNSLILLDEVEKAHPVIWDSFLQVLDAGRMTDSHGEIVDFSKTVIVMTSNLGANERTKTTHGFTAGVDTMSYEKEMDLRRRNAMKNMEMYFKPEFVNRIDDTFVFDILPDNVLKDIALIELKYLVDKVSSSSANKSTLSVPDDVVIDKIISMSDARKFGARDIKRTVKRNISYLLADSMLKSKQKNISLTLDLDEENNIIVKSEKAKRKPAMKAKKS